MIVVFTSNYNAGILQLACQISKTVKKIYNDEVVLFLPEQAEIHETIKTEKYIRISNLGPTKAYEKVAKRIESYCPRLVFVCESSLITARIVNAISSNIKVLMCVHDVNPHPNYGGLLAVLKEKAKLPYISQGWNRSDGIVLLSNNSLTAFNSKYPKLRNKTYLMTLGAHIPVAETSCPIELKNKKISYLLFFGRMDKYKGIESLLKAYVNSTLQEENIYLVIAGNGNLTEQEEKIISEHQSHIMLIKRYIEDGEMIWLMQNCLGVTLPYIEASQSGVLPIAYAYGKPVIVSDVKGLTDFVLDGETGIIYHTEKEFVSALELIGFGKKNFGKKIMEYYEKNLLWENNVKRCVDNFV